MTTRTFEQGVTEEFAIDGMRKELHAMQEILGMQQQEYYKMQSHVELLEAEIDSLQAILESKQTVINKLNNKVSGKVEAISDLSTKLDETTIDRKAYDELDNLNTTLLNKVREKERQIEELEIEMRMFNEGRDDMLLYTNDKSLKNAELDIIVNTKIVKMETQLKTASEAIAEKDAYIKLLEDNNKDLNARLKMSEELRVEQITRSRQSEYRNLSRLNEVSDTLYKTLDDKELNDETMGIITMRGDLLQAQLNNVTNTLDRSQETFGSIVDNMENESHKASRKEQKLIIQNEQLQIDLQVTEIKLKRLLHDHQKSKELTPFAKSLLKHQEQQQKNFATQRAKDASSLSKTTGSSGSSAMKKKVHDSKSTTKFYNTGSIDLSATSPAILFSTTGTTSRTEGHYEYAPAQTNFSLSSSGPLILTTASKANNQMQNDRDFSKPKAVMVDVNQLKDSFLSKYLATIVAGADTTVASSSKGEKLDLVQCEITDQDLNKIIGWFRIMDNWLTPSVAGAAAGAGGSTNRTPRYIDLRYNRITGDGLTKLVVWLLSLPTPAPPPAPMPIYDQTPLPPSFLSWQVEGGADAGGTGVGGADIPSSTPALDSTREDTEQPASSGTYTPSSSGLPPLVLDLKHNEISKQQVLAALSLLRHSSSSSSGIPSFSLIATESNDEVLLVYGAESMRTGREGDSGDDDNDDDDQRGSRGRLLFKIDVRFQASPWAQLQSTAAKSGTYEKQQGPAVIIRDPRASLTSDAPISYALLEAD